MDRATFVTMAVPGTGALQALLLASSLREFGGTVAGEPIWALVPDGGKRMSLGIAEEFAALGVRLIPFGIDDETRAVPFSTKAAGAAYVEQQAETDLLVWLDADTIVVGGGREFLLDESAALGYRPVHHRLIGLDADGPVDGLWSAVLQACGVAEDALFRMYTSVGERVKAYFNAGTFVVRPELGLLTRWSAVLGSLGREGSIAAWFREEPLYETFFHQMVWTAVLLRHLDRGRMLELSPAVNYPLHLHEQIPAGRRAISLQRLTSVRTEDLLLDPEWRERLPILGSLVPWLETQPLMAGR